MAYVAAGGRARLPSQLRGTAVKPHSIVYGSIPVLDVSSDEFGLCEMLGKGASLGLRPGPLRSRGSLQRCRCTSHRLVSHLVGTALQSD